MRPRPRMLTPLGVAAIVIGLAVVAILGGLAIAGALADQFQASLP
jgi:hypothetical protein